MRRFSAEVFAKDYPGGIVWEWRARNVAAALADAIKWSEEEFAGPVHGRVTLMEYPNDEGASFELDRLKVKEES